ncbi:hypothetical protein D7Y13_15250 [Corallococcus praedator]|uniref:Helix-turn-helix domain-containing protein n=1 Tax=Corallococcus praedator TaxID=2316724 RepID=A0ABX9QJ05_9BACT|nr:MULTISPECIES: hypothetical protein [Corallococcus]RKH28977.1 hypothetical protein D7X75_23735 [Corallococcus sp. CA031C]RKI08837.1 hypothetical protein D7Y13_15250 [Corallococcus praedator]
MDEKKPKKPKFKYTRELVKIALSDGMTQQEVGDLCRVEQSVVSGWANGRSLAFEHQVAELKKRYGNRLNRTTSRVYLAVSGEVPGARWEDTERARRLMDLRDQLRREQALAEKSFRSRVARKAQNQSEAVGVGVDDERVSDAQDDGASSKSAQLESSELQEAILPGEEQQQSLDTLIEFDREEFEAARPTQLMQVEGPLVLRYTFVRLVPVLRKGIELERLPVARWLVHRQANGRFVLVAQERRILLGRARWHWRRILKGVQEEAHRRFASGVRGIDVNFKQLAHDEPYVECADDSARWLSSIHGPLDSNALIGHCDAFFAGKKHHGPHDAMTLPFLVRKMLIEHGHDVPGVVRIVASE